MAIFEVLDGIRKLNINVNINNPAPANARPEPPIIFAAHYKGYAAHVTGTFEKVFGNFVQILVINKPCSIGQYNLQCHQIRLIPAPLIVGNRIEAVDTEHNQNHNDTTERKFGFFYFFHIFIRVHNAATVAL